MGTRAATSAGRRRSTARGKRDGARANGSAPKRTGAAKSRRARAAPKRSSKRAAPKRSSKRAAPKRSSKRAAPKRSSKRAAPRRNAKRATKRARFFSRAGLVSLRGAIAVLALTGALTAGYYFWLRDSSLVAVTEVEVEGVTGPDREEITVALRRAARDMTTLHVQPERLQQAVGSFPTVETVRADAGLPHSLRIEVIERPPTLVVSAGDREVPVAADGTVLAGIDAPDSLPRLGLEQIPDAGRLQGEALDQALVAGGAPEELRSLIEQISYTDEAGVALQMAGEVELRFGSGARAEAKWAAAAAVLADPKLQSATYVDVRVPERPTVGGGGESTVAVPETAAETVPPATDDVVSTGG